ncbi:MAG: hypothetical protein C0623_08120 [Desulfuromonas sp.]|nr:MAG: hypothetical protein C0623_08120 [Desulfuromonas sp.]
MGIFKRKTGQPNSATSELQKQGSEPIILKQCLCADGHNLISGQATFSGHPGITLKLHNDRQEGLLSLSPIIGDKDRSFFGNDWMEGEIVKIGCPTCSEPLPVYNECFCGADLVAMFTTSKSDFANCIGICQRIGCTHAEIISNHDLRVISRSGAFDKGTDLYGRV